ncbi:hypothetical protein CEXT_287691 [Caerostris extrusa]|uniref:Uncharacterized protein n=1 Tax=Caerostris extrusa TaxID=172846 RepID=A0AAV4S999_CAEEX|nr:hypothetical protein CEXT_287691 [Caerostris extrusa]
MKVFLVLFLVAVTFAFEIREQSCPTNKTWGEFGDCPRSPRSLFQLHQTRGLPISVQFEVIRRNPES